jgi:hypothetical protein
MKKKMKKKKEKRKKKEVRRNWDSIIVFKPVPV